jgi:hypothetical protein
LELDLLSKEDSAEKLGENEVNQPQPSDPILEEDIVSLAPFGRLVGRYRHWLIVSFFGCGLAGVGLLATLALVAPYTTNASIGLGLKFARVGSGQYPNRQPFSPIHLISTEVLMKVYQANGLEQYLPFDDFKNSLTIKPSGDSLAALQLEYKRKLGGPKILPEERKQLENEFKVRRQAIVKSEYSLVWTQKGRLAKMVPASVKAKVLEEIPRRWAEDAVYIKKVLAMADFLPTRIQSENSVEKVVSNAIDIGVRSRVLSRGLAELSGLSGGTQLKLPNGTTLVDLQNRLRVLREVGLNRIQEALVTFSADKEEKIKLQEMLRGRLRSRERAFFLEKSKLEPIEKGYRDYLASRRGVDSGYPGKARGLGDGGTTFQINDNFLDKYIEMTKPAADEEYRQALVDQISTERQGVLEMERNVDEIKLYLDSIHQEEKKWERTPSKDPAGVAGQPERMSQKEALQIMQEVATELNSIIVEAEQIRSLAWKNLIQPQTLLYSITTPFEINSRSSFLSLRTSVMLFAGFIFLGMIVTLLVCWVFDSSRNFAQKDQEALRSSSPPQTS